jgi:hypothetical protein
VKLTWSHLLPGSYSVTETAQPEWSTTTTGSPATVPADGGKASATVTNARKLGSVKVTKVVDWNGVAPVDGTTFTICITGPTYPGGNCKLFTYPGDLEKVWTDLVPGDYTVTETGTSQPAPGGEKPSTPGASPQARAGMALAYAGENPARLLASPVEAPPAPTVENPVFNICVTGPSYPGGDCRSFPYPDGLVQTWTNLLPGQYTVTETDPGSQWQVEITGSPATVPAEGGQATASVKNTRLPDKPPQPPVVTITASGDDAVLSWPAVTKDVDGRDVTVIKYQVWRSESPYFLPEGPPWAEVTAPATSWADAGALADVARNYSYIVRAVSAAGLTSADSNRTGEFGYTLAKGG